MEYIKEWSKNSTVSKQQKEKTQHFMVRSYLIMKYSTGLIFDLQFLNHLSSFTAIYIQITNN